MPDYLPTQEQKLVTWLNNFLTVANADISSLGISPTALSALQADTTLLIANLTNVASSKAIYEGNVQAKDASIAQAAKSVRPLVKQIQNNVTVSDALRAQLGINVPSPVRNKTAPVTPADVLATPDASGINMLKWNTTGNKSATQYVILPAAHKRRQRPCRDGLGDGGDDDQLV